MTMDFITRSDICHHTFAIAVSAMVVTAHPSLADWPQFRGVNCAGLATGPAPPTDFGPGVNELWKTPLDTGHSSPCIVGDSIFLTSYELKSKQLAVLCLSRGDGSVRWRHLVNVGKIERGHPSFNPASCTPVSDGERVVAYFGSFGLLCLDLEGTKLWELRLPLTKSYSGNATSPIIANDRVILYRANHVDHFLLAVDKKSGEQLWKKRQRERFTGAIAGTATPIVTGDKVIVHAAQAVKAFNLDNGELLWQANCSTTATSTPVLAGEEVIVATWNQTGEPALVPVFPHFDQLLEKNDADGDKLISPAELPKLMYFHRSEGTEAPQNGWPLRFSDADANKDRKIVAEEWQKLLTRTAKRRKGHVRHGLVAINVNSHGKVTGEQIRYLETRSIPEVPSPVYRNGRVYFVKNGGILSCLDVKSGDKVFRMRTGGRGTHYASPVIAGDKLFAASGEGVISVVSLSGDPRVLRTNRMPDKTYATPAIVDGTIYVRTHSALYAFGKR